MARFVALLVSLMFAVACSASTTSITSDLDVERTPSFTAEPIATAQPTATSVVTATEPAATAEPTTSSATATVPPEPTATPAATAATEPMPVDMTPAEFALVWDILAPSAAEMIPEGQDLPALSDPSTGIYAELELNTFRLSDGVLMATSLTDGRIDGYVVFFDPDSIEAIKALVLVSLSVGEPVISGAVLDAVYQGEPAQLSDVPIIFDGVNHKIELLRTGADPANDPLWILTASPTGSTIDHRRLRLAGAEAAGATF